MHAGAVVLAADLAKDDVVLGAPLVGDETQLGFGPVHAIGRFRIAERRIVGSWPAVHVVALVPHPVFSAVLQHAEPVQSRTLPRVLGDDQLFSGLARGMQLEFNARFLGDECVINKQDSL